MSLFGSALNMYGRSFSALGRFAFSPFPFTLFTLPTAGLLVAPFILATFIPIMAIVAVASCLGCLFDPNPYPAYPRQTVVVQDTSPSWWSFGGLFDWGQRPYTGPTYHHHHRHRPHHDHYHRNPSYPTTGRSWPNVDTGPQFPSTGPTTTGGFFDRGRSQVVTSGPTTHGSMGPSAPSTGPTMGGGQYVVG